MAFATKDVVLKEDRPRKLLLQKHSDYLASYGLNKNDYEYCMTEYLRMSGIYWSLTAMELMGQSSRLVLSKLTFNSYCYVPIPFQSTWLFIRTLCLLSSS